MLLSVIMRSPRLRSQTLRLPLRSQKTAKISGVYEACYGSNATASMLTGLPKRRLAEWMRSGSICQETVYAEGADALAESPSAFERWCDNRIIQTISPQKYEAFSVGPVVAYVISKTK